MSKSAPIAGDDACPRQLAVSRPGRRPGRGRLRSLRRPAARRPHSVRACPCHLAIRRDQEAVLVRRRVDRQARDQADVRTFRRLDRADAAVVRNVHVADFEARSLAVQTARTEGRQPALVREHRQRVRLVDDLRQLAAAEEVFDRRRDALGIDQAARRHVLDVLQAHPLLHGAAQLEEALAQLVAGQLVDRAQAAIAEVIDVVDFDAGSPSRSLQEVLDRVDQILGPQRHLGLRARSGCSLRLMRKRPTLPRR